MNEGTDRAMLQLAASRLQEQNRREIERAIDRIKKPRSADDNWFRKQWYCGKVQRERRSYIREPARSGDGDAPAQRWRP